MRLCPDGRWIAAQPSEQLYLLPRPPDPAVAVDLTAPENPARKVTDMGAHFFDWRADGSLIWTVGNYLQPLPDTDAPMPTGHGELVPELPRAGPQGHLLSGGGRELTMAGRGRSHPDAHMLIDGEGKDGKGAVRGKGGADREKKE